MILLDSDVLILDFRYKRDPRYPVNRRVLGQILSGQVLGGITSHTLLEVVGNMSFNVPSADVPLLPALLAVQYNLLVLPDPGAAPDYAGCTVPELIAQMGVKMSLGDAVQAVQIARFARNAQCLLTWNAKHFMGKIAIPVLTPQEWLNQQQPGTTP